MTIIIQLMLESYIEGLKEERETQSDSISHK